MKRIAAAIGVLGALLVCAAALAATSVNGTYTATLGSGPLKGAVKGTWTLNFASPKYTVAYNGSVSAKGSYSLSGNKITFSDKSGPRACPGKGVYTYKLNGRILTFKKVSDSNAKCAGRSAVLAGTFTKKFASSPGGY